jgi:hypothetical protein
MELFRTVLSPLNWDFKIDYPSTHFLIGSCFSEHIGKRIELSKFRTCLNPFGILFHPLAISRVMQRLIDGKPYSKEELRFEDERFISFDHHGRFNHSQLDIALEKINTSFERARKELKEADFIYITWGTSIGYTPKEIKDKVVSNCHKIPPYFFTKVHTSSSDIVKSYASLFKKLRVFNSSAKIIISVSPVKHIKDGLIENNRSKARLLEAAHQLCESDDNSYYFPAFELVQDDLRDYRFYTKDMVHPNEQAVDYIWDYYQNNLWSPECIALNKKITNLQKSFNHRVLHPENEQHRSFVEHTIKKATELEKQFPYISFEIEKQALVL